MFIANVKSSDGTKTYTVRRVGEQLICSCHDHVFRSGGAPYLCKHLAALVAEVTTFAATAAKSKKAEELLAA